MLRTGFTIAGLGSLVTSLLGRGNWPAWLMALLSSVFVLVGLGIAQAGLIRFRHISDKLKVDDDLDPVPTRLILSVTVLLQVTLIALLLFYLLSL